MLDLLGGQKIQLQINANLATNLLHALLTTSPFQLYEECVGSVVALITNMNIIFQFRQLIP